MARKDARRVKVSGMAQVMFDLKPGRCNSDVYINQKMDLTNLVKYIEKQNSKEKKYSYFHAFVTAIGKTFYNRPKLNYFVANRHLYEHKDVIISFVAKVAFEDNAEEVMIMVPIDPKDNLDTISKKIKEKVKYNRSDELVKEGANSAIDVIGKLPNIIRVPLMGILKWTDRKGILPSSLTKDNLYYSSMIVSNLGSIKCGAIYHNITNFGTASGLATFGEIKDVEIINDKGKKEIRKICEFGINLDERIADGYYFAKSVNFMQYLFDNPSLLEEEMDKLLDMKEIR